MCNHNMITELFNISVEPPHPLLFSMLNRQHMFLVWKMICSLFLCVSYVTERECI